MQTVDDLRLTEPPVWTGEAAAYPWSEKLAKHFTVLDRYEEDEINLWKREGDQILIPRALAPMGADDRRQSGVPIDFRPEGQYRSITARDSEQERVIMEASDLLDAGESFIIQAATGFGKTPVACELIADVGRKTLIILPLESMFTDWRAEIKQHLGLEDHEIGLIKGDTFRVDGCKIVLGSLKSLGIPGRYPVAPFRQFGFVIWDEVHAANAPTFGTTGMLVPAALRMGFSATPYRSDGKEILMFANIGPMRVAASDAMLPFTVGQYLSPWKCPGRYRTDPDGCKVWVPIKHSGKNSGHVISLMAKDRGHNRLVQGRITDAYRAGRYIIVFSDRITQLETLQAIGHGSGIPPGDSGIYRSGLSERRRLEIRECRIMYCTYGMARMALNVPRLDTLAFATPRAEVQQIVGRIRRFQDGKPRPVVLDFHTPSSHVFGSWASTRRAWYETIDGTNMKKYWQD